MGHSECPQRYPVDDADEKERTGWGGRIRTYDTRYQKPMPYRLATPQRAALVTPGRRGDQDPLLTKTPLITISAGLRGCRVSPARAVRTAQVRRTRHNLIGSALASRSNPISVSTSLGI